MKLRRLFALSAGLLLFPALARAHLMNSGFGPFYDGLVHPLIVPEDLLPVLAVVLCGALRGPAVARLILWLLPLAWGAGMVLAALGLPFAAPVWLTALLTLLAGVLTGADLPLHRAIPAGLALVIGLLHGCGNGAELMQLPKGTLAMTGILCTLLFLASLIGGQTASIQARWARIGVRISGSWIAAISLLMLGWTFRKSP